MWHDDTLKAGNLSGEGIEFSSEQNGQYVTGASGPRIHQKLSDEGVYLKLSKRGTQYEGFYSIDGENYTRISSIPVPSITNPQIGFYTSAVDGRSCSTGVDIPVNFDFFRVNEMAAGQTSDQQPAHIRWITSQPQNSCDNICKDTDLTAVSPGSNQDGTFYVCRIHEDNRSGFNIPMADIWDQCLVGYGGIERIDDQFDCLCAEK